MKTKLIFLSAFIFICGLVTAQTGTKNFLDVNYIEVTGKADIEITPDEIYLRIKINEEDNKGKVNVEDLQKKMIKALEKIGINIKEDFTVMDFTSDFHFHWIKKTNIYTAKEYQLITHNAKTTAEVYKSLEDLGISNISVFKVDHSEIEKYRKDVKVKAIIAAKDKAKSLASAIDQNIGKALYILENNNYGYAERANVSYMSRSKSAETIPEPEFKKIKLEYSILARFELK